MKFTNRNKKLNYYLSLLEENFEAYVGLLLVAIYGSIIFWNIVVRELGQGNLIIADTLSKTLGIFTWVAWLGAAYGVRKESHFRFLIVRKNFGRKLQLITYSIEWVLWFLVCGVILWFSLDILQSQVSTGATTRGLPIPTYLFYLAIPVGFSFLILRIIQQIVDTVGAYREGEDITPDQEI